MSSSVSPTPRSTRPTGPPVKRLSLADVTTKAKRLPTKCIVHGVGGIGKTSLAAYMPVPFFLNSRLETGIEDLKDAGLVPETIGSLNISTWTDVIDACNLLLTEKHDYRTLVVDVLNGMERLCHEHVCARDYGGSWPKFTAYQAGFEVAIGDWRQFLGLLDELRATRNMTVVLLAHTKVRPFRNPEGPDYDRYLPDMHERTWSVTYGWAGMVLFANYLTELSQDGRGKPKARGGEERFLYTTRSAAFDAKHRHGLAEMVSMGKSGAEAWKNLSDAIKAGKQHIPEHVDEKGNGAS